MVGSIRSSNQSTSSSIPSLCTQLEKNASSAIPLTLYVAILYFQLLDTNTYHSSNELINEEGLDASVCGQIDGISLEEKRIKCNNRLVQQIVIPSIGAESGM